MIITTALRETYPPSAGELRLPLTFTYHGCPTAPQVYGSAMACTVEMAGASLVKKHGIHLEILKLETMACGSKVLNSFFVYPGLTSWAIFLRPSGAGTGPVRSKRYWYPIHKTAFTTCIRSTWNRLPLSAYSLRLWENNRPTALATPKTWGWQYG